VAHEAGPDALRAAALRLLARREYSRAELRRKLALQVEREARRRAEMPAPRTAKTAAAKAGTAAAEQTRCSPPEHDPATHIESVLDHLERRGLLSDERTAQQWLDSRAPRHGERRLRQDLGAKGLAPELLARTLAQARETEESRALALWQRRFGQRAPDAAGHARQLRFLAGRGFSIDTIQRVMRQAQHLEGAGAADTCEPDEPAAAGRTHVPRAGWAAGSDPAS
jgi:regulatory protein